MWPPDGVRQAPLRLHHRAAPGRTNRAAAGRGSFTVEPRRSPPLLAAGPLVRVGTRHPRHPAGRACALRAARAGPGPVVTGACARAGAAPVLLSAGARTLVRSWPRAGRPGHAAPPGRKAGPGPGRAAAGRFAAGRANTARAQDKGLAAPPGCARRTAWACGAAGPQGRTGALARSAAGPQAQDLGPCARSRWKRMSGAWRRPWAAREGLGPGLAAPLGRAHRTRTSCSGSILFNTYYTGIIQHVLT